MHRSKVVTIPSLPLAEAAGFGLCPPVGALFEDGFVALPPPGGPDPPEPDPPKPGPPPGEGGIVGTVGSEVPAGSA